MCVCQSVCIFLFLELVCVSLLHSPGQGQHLVSEPWQEKGRALRHARRVAGGAHPRPYGVGGILCGVAAARPLCVEVRFSVEVKLHHDQRRTCCPVSCATGGKELAIHAGVVDKVCRRRP